MDSKAILNINYKARINIILHFEQYYTTYDKEDVLIQYVRDKDSAVIRQ